MSDKNKTTDVSHEQANAIINAKETLASKQDVLMTIGQIQAFHNIQKYTTVGELLLFKKIKESKEYKGLVYVDDDGKSTTVGDIKEVCTHFFHRSYSSMQEGLVNLELFGEEFLKSSQNMGLGNRELRKLRQLPNDSQQLIINSKEVDLSDKEAVKELIEDEALKHSLEINQLEKAVKEAEQTTKAVRANSDEKTKQLDQIKEIEAKRKFSQDPWKGAVLDHAKGMLEARISIEKGINQLTDIFKSFQKQEAVLDEKAVKLIARSLVTETTCTNQLVDEFCNSVFGLLGGIVEADLDAGEIYQELELDLTPESDTAE